MTLPNQATPLSEEFYKTHAALLCESFERLLKRPLLPIGTAKSIEALDQVPFVLLSHGTQEDPIFNYGNQSALSLFELTWSQLLELPSRKSAEAMNREERQKLLDMVSSYGFIDDYSGIRISSTGKRFRIENAIVWNLIDRDGNYHGQAAMFDRWTYL